MTSSAASQRYRTSSKIISNFLIFIFVQLVLGGHGSDITEHEVNILGLGKQEKNLSCFVFNFHNLSNISMVCMTS